MISTELYEQSLLWMNEDEDVDFSEIQHILENNNILLYVEGTVMFAIIHEHNCTFQFSVFFGIQQGSCYANYDILEEFVIDERLGVFADHVEIQDLQKYPFDWKKFRVCSYDLLKEYAQSSTL